MLDLRHFVIQDAQDGHIWASLLIKLTGAEVFPWNESAQPSSPSVHTESTRGSKEQASTGFLEKEGVKLVENNIIEIKTSRPTLSDTRLSVGENRKQTSLTM